MKRYADCIVELENAEIGQTIIGNTNNGLWVKMDSDIKEILDDFINQKNENMLNDLCEDEIQSLLFLVKKLERIGFIEDAEKDSERVLITEVTIAITNRCNLSCIHCSVNANENQQEMSLDEMKKAIINISKLNPEVIVVTGGEPLIRNDFIDIIRFIKQNSKAKINLMTNATLIDEEFMKIISDIDSIDISIDGVDEISCSKIRGKGVFEKVVNSINKIKEHNKIKTSLSMVETEYNRNYIDEFYRLSEKLDCKPVIRKLEYIGRAEKNRDKLKQQNLNYEKLEIEQDYDLKNVKVEANFYSCGAFVREIFINHLGKIYPCPLFDFDVKYCIGDILDDNFVDKVYAVRKSAIHNKLKNLYEKLPNKCSKCNVRYFCHTCPFVSLNSMKDMKDFEELCEGRRSYIEGLVWGK